LVALKIQAPHTKRLIRTTIENVFQEDKRAWRHDLSHQK
jgi:hypothetical protein